MVNTAPSMSIGVLASAAGVNLETIRHYQRKGLLVPARQRGEIPTLDEVAGLMTLGEGTDCGKVRLMAEHKGRDVRARIEDLKRLASALESLAADCAAARQTPECPLIGAPQSEVAAR